MRNNCLAKKGVSLVTVLIFMMIATIATTATYKWLSSAGFTSADRMAMSEAKEASHAGLESVRSWMTYHANDVGAILRQYYDGGKKPVALTNVVRGMNSSKQVFNVWLTGVETSGSAYKFTIVSNGIARGDAKYSETSVLKVRGLYKVREPEVIVESPVDFKQTYFGGTMEGAGDNKNSSMVINGNWKGNPTAITEDFIITGNFELSGNNVDLGQHACIGGELRPQNNGVAAGDIYVKGSITGISATIRGNAVFDKSVTVTNAGHGLDVGGDLTLKGSYTTERTKQTRIRDNLCVEASGKLNIGELYQDFTVEHSVNVKTGNLFQNSMGSSTIEHTNFGGNGYSVYMPDLGTCNSSGNPVHGCKSGWMFQRSNFFKSSAIAVSMPTKTMFCDTSIVTYCDSILGKPTKGCDNTKYKINDMITTAYDSFKQLVDKVPCAKITGNTDNYDMGKLNTCYKNVSNSPTLMYHGYLVVGVHGSGDQSIFKNPTGKLDGNFIFVSENKISMLNMPPTTDTSKVFFYMAKGAGMVNTPETRQSAKYNYFFYSKADIDELQHRYRGGTRGDTTWNGSFYLTATNCARIKRVNTSHIGIVYNEPLVQSLVDNAIICNIREEGSCGGLVSDHEDDINHDGEELNVEGGFDKYYVATAPQLSITLESQRRNKEILYDNLTSSQYTTVKPSIVVLPRIIYMSDVPEGKLEHYYKVINLNGAKETFSAANTKCTPNLNTSGLITGGSPLEHPVYKCEYTSKTSSYGKIPFWVVVDAHAAQKSAVSFVGTETRIFGGGTVTVRMNVDGSQHDPVTAVVRVTEVPEGWHVQPSGDYVTAGELQDDGSRLYSVILQPGMETPVFAVSSASGSDNNQVNFTIVSVGENGRMGAPLTHSVWLDGAATIVREDIPKTGFCDANKHKTINGVSCSEVLARPECTGNLIFASLGDWVRPSCPDITTQDPNKQWGCGLSDAEDVMLQETRNASPYCDVFIPDSSIGNLQDGHTYTLYASYKAKEFTLKLFLNGATKSKVEVRTSDQIIDANTPLSDITSSMCNAGDTCRIKVFAGRHIELRHKDASGEEFKTWNFVRSDGSLDYISKSDKMPVSLIHDSLVVAEYADIENHCFYTDFKDVGIWCNGSKDNCIDTCKVSGKNSSCNTNGGGNYPTSDWLLPRTNNGQKYSRPTKQGEFIYYSAGKNANSGNSTISYLLNRTQAGGHGTLTSRFKACFREMKGNSYTPLNSGFILRSTENSSRYSIVQVYGRASQMTSVGNYVMEVRVCEGDGSGIKNENQGDCKKASFPGIILTPAEFTGIVFNTDIEVFGDSAKVKLSYKREGSWVRSSVNIPLLVGANVNEYVGLSMADDCFKVMNLGWSSDDWDPEHCFDIPNVSCSFAANYLGGILPLNEDVKPWVGTSSYFNDPANPDKLLPGCKVTYHYNGCDLAPGYAKHSCETWLDGTTHCSSCSADSEGPYFVSGVYADVLEKSKDDKYNFTYAGLHGTTKYYDYNGENIEGAVRSASVVIDCNNQGGNGHTYEASCGRFVVGSINECSQGTSFHIDNCDNQSSCVARVSGGVANLRSSSIMGEISGLPDSDGSGNIPIVTMVMTDANGTRSQEFLISGNGSFSRSVDLMSDMQEFDPERVVSIEFTASSGFTVAGLVSDCPNSVGVHGCEATLDGDRFVISSNLVNSGEALCKVTGVDNSYETTEKDCPTEGKFYIPAVDLQKNINISGGDRSYTFTVSVKPKNGGDEMTCTTPAVDVRASELTCDLSSTAPINPGDNLPSLNYKITNCPPSGCAVDARIGSEPPVRLTYRGNGQVNSWSPNINTTPGNYRYTLTYAGLSCTADITVVTGANGSTADNCAIDEASKRFTADLNLAVGNTNTVKLWYMDKLGNIIDRSKNVSPSTTRFDEPLPAMSEAGDYVVALSINGEEVCSVLYSYAGDEPADEAQCYIEGGRFKTKNKNTGETIYSVSLNYSTDGSPYGNTVSSGSWPKDGYVDMDAYLPTAPGTYTYNLWGSGLLCSVTYEVKDETTDNSDENP